MEISQTASYNDPLLDIGTLTEPPSRRRNTYTHAFKLAAVRLSLSGSHSVAEVGRMLNVNESLLYRWKRELADEARATSEDVKASGETVQTADASVLEHLYAELKRLRHERDVLRKAIPILIKNQG